jgi:hypothetical protein
MTTRPPRHHVTTSQPPPSTLRPSPPRLSPYLNIFEVFYTGSGAVEPDKDNDEDERDEQ